MINNIIAIAKSYWCEDVLPFFRIMFSASNKSTQEAPSGLKYNNSIDSYEIKSKVNTVTLEEDEHVQLSEMPYIGVSEEE